MQEVSRGFVVQHNALVNAHFTFGTVTARVFLLLLAQLDRADTSFKLCRIPARAVLEQSNSENYDLLRATVDKLAKQFVRVQQLGTDGRGQRTLPYSAIPLLAIATYVPQAAVLELRFNDELRAYLLELHGHFTQAQLGELLKLKTSVATRIYWLLREYARFGRRTFLLDELKAILGLPDCYDRFNNFRTRVLEPAQRELQHTDLPFFFTTRSQGRRVTHLEFTFPAAEGSSPVQRAGAARPVGTARPVSPPAPVPELTGWEAAVVAAGIAVTSLPAIRERLVSGHYDEPYVHYSLQQVRLLAAAGKIKRPAGALFKALTSDYYLADYRQQATPKPAPAKINLARARQRQKVQDGLTDLQNSRQFISTHAGYSNSERQRLLASLADNERQLLTQLTHLA